MSFQVRHPEMGVFQGHCLGLAFWHPMSEMPEQGFCAFPTRDEAEDFVRQHVEYNEQDRIEDFIVEPYDAQTCQALRLAANEKVGMLYQRTN